MIEMTVADVRDFLRADTENDIVIAPLLAASIGYIESAVGAENASAADPRCLLAVQLKLYDLFHADVVYDPTITALISQIRADPQVIT